MDTPCRCGANYWIGHTQACADAHAAALAVPRKWAVLNVSVTAILGVFNTEAEAKEAAEHFGAASFAYELSDEEVRKM